MANPKLARSSTIIVMSAGLLFFLVRRMSRGRSRFVKRNDLTTKNRVLIPNTQRYQVSKKEGGREMLVERAKRKKRDIK